VEASALRAPAGFGRISVSARFLRVRSDEQLLALFRGGSEEAFGVIHERYRQRLFAYARQMLGGSRQDAEDVMQDVFLRAYSALRADARPVALRAWLYRVAHNRCIDQLRRGGPTPVEIVEDNSPDLRDPLAEAEQREELRRLLEDVRRLPVHQRSALVMRELDGLSYSELAAALGVSVAAVKSLLVRARVGLAEAVEARDSACSEIRSELALALDNGSRASTRARRHMRDCDGCRAYRGELRAVRRRFAALVPAVGPLGLIAKLTGGSGAAALGGSAATGGGAAGAGGGLALAGGAATISATKVAAIVCAAAVVTAEGAIEVKKHIAPPPAHHKVMRVRPAVMSRPPTAAPVVVSAKPQPLKAAAIEVPALPDETTDAAVTDPDAVSDPTLTETGGAAAPDDLSDSATPADDTTAPTADGTDGQTRPTDGSTPSKSGDTSSSGSSTGSTSGSGDTSGAQASGSSSGSQSPSSSGGSSSSSGTPPPSDTNR
jgi:RNA polymerase sigma factor (sigma-70 family)